MATEKRLIWGDIAENQLMKLAEYYKGSFSGDAFERAAKQIAELPTVDAAVVVPCNNCKHYVWDEFDGCYACLQIGRFVKPDFWCAYGERKDND